MSKKRNVKKDRRKGEKESLKWRENRKLGGLKKREEKRTEKREKRKENREKREEKREKREEKRE